MNKQPDNAIWDICRKTRDAEAATEAKCKAHAATILTAAANALGFTKKAGGAGVSTLQGASCALRR